MLGLIIWVHETNVKFYFPKTTSLVKGLLIYFHENGGIFGVSDSVCTVGKLENTRYIKNIKGGTFFTFCVCEKNVTKQFLPPPFLNMLPALFYTMTKPTLYYIFG